MPRALLSLVLLVLLEAPVVAANHNGTDEEPPTLDASGVGTGVPIVDTARDDVLARQASVARSINSFLISQGVPPETLLPESPANVFKDNVHPGSRVGGLGPWRTSIPDWRIESGGVNGTYWTVANATTGKYGTMDGLLILPVLDLSAYPLQTGNVPFINRGGGVNNGLEDFILAACPPMVPATRIPTAGLCLTAAKTAPEAIPISDQINLLLRHRLNFLHGRDGAQVLLFERDPLQPGAEGILLTPQRGFYQGVRAFDPRPGGPTWTTQTAGYTGYRDWSTDAFDLTPWSGKMVWIALRVATGSQASTDPEYFSRTSFPNEGPYGWSIDDIEVVSPAYPVNLKVESIFGPTFRASPGSPRIAAPGENLTIGAEVLHAAAVPRATRVVLRIEGAGEPIEQTFLANLTPGQVWTPNVTLTAPSSGTIRVRAEAYNPGPANTTLHDPTFADNVKEESFDVFAVERVSATIRATDVMVDDGETVGAVAVVQNDGNLALPVDVRLIEYVGPEGRQTPRPQPRQDLFLRPGENATLRWSFEGDVRGEHRLVLHANSTAVSATTKASFYVHAAPPPVFNATSWPPAAGWETYTADVGVPPEDEWMWVASSGSRVDPVLRALPTPEAVQAGGQFRDLRLYVRYMPVRNDAETNLLLATTPGPFQAAVLGPGQTVTVSDPGTSVFWRTTLPRSTHPNPSSPLGKEWDLTWKTVDRPIDLQATDGYPGVWTATSPELRVVAGLPHEEGVGPAGVINQTKFYLDELRITGIPLGGEEADRIDVIRITGSEPFVSRNSASASVSTDFARAGLVTPAEPSFCGWEGVSRLEYPNCWRPMHRSEAERLAVRSIHWQNRTAANLSLLMPDGTPVVYGYVYDDTVAMRRVPERLLTPAFRFDEVVRPRLSFLTSFAFPGQPLDYTTPTAVPKYRMSQVGFAQIQYRMENGDWSDFHWLSPTGGYKSVLERNLAQTPRVPDNDVIDYTVGDGFHHPSPCEQSGRYTICDAGGFHMNLAADGKTYWLDYGPRNFSRAEFDLAIPGVNLSGKEVRLGFHASTMYNAGTCPVACRTHWYIGGLRVTSVDKFAVDGSVRSIGLNVPYEWRTIGVGPGTTVPVNVTVRNEGIYAEQFQVNFTVGLRNGGELAYEVVSVGQLKPDEERSLIIPWNVPHGEERAYVLSATISPTGTADEKPFDDRLQLGDRGELAGRTRSDAAITAAVFPSRGRDSLARHMPITVHNYGNVPLDGIRVTRTVERLGVAGPELVNQTTWRFRDPLPPNPQGVPFQTLAAEPEVTPDDLFFTPGLPGEYTVGFRVTTSREDAEVDDNVAGLPFTAVEPLFAQDFEDPVTWANNAADLWGDGPGFRSPHGLLAANRTTGALPTSSDVWIQTPPVPLSNAMNAVVNAFFKYDLEDGYDGARVEVSKDGVTWIPLHPSDARGLRSEYASRLVPSNPLSAGPGESPAAISGDSRAATVNIDGWTPYSFNLQDVPELSEPVGFRELTAPQVPETPEEPTFVPPGTFYAPSMVLDPAMEDQRWEVQNQTEITSLTPGIWWSGRASSTPLTQAVTLRRDFNVSDLDVNSTLVLSWWDWRAGSRGDSWGGISGKYFVNITQPDESNIQQSVAGAFHVGGKNGAWFPMRLEARREAIDPSRPLRVEFRLESFDATASDLGWALDEVLLASERVEAGERRMVRNYTELEETLGVGNWTSIQEGAPQGWMRVAKVPSRPIPWVRATMNGADGLPKTAWRADIPATAANVDARLVSPAVDLGELGGARAALRITHAYNLGWREDGLGSDMLLSQRKYYRAGTVEIQVLNRTTAQWDPWRQLFAAGATPVDAPRPRPDPRHPAAPFVGEGAPYNATLIEAGDSFERYPRSFNQHISPSGVVAYYRNYLANVSYAFAGVPADDWVTSEFDLTPYAGQRVRFAFHAYAGAVDPQGARRHWTIDKAEVIGYVLSSPDVSLRFRVGTDASIQEGHFAVDQLEVSGRRYERSVGLHLDPMPLAIAPGNSVVVSGNLTNYGTETRRLIAVGVRDSRLNDFRVVVPITERPGSYPEGYAAVSGPFDLTPAGTPNSTSRFEFNVGVGNANEKYDLTLEVLEASVSGGALAYAPVKDDVPGRARRSLELQSLSIRGGRLDEVRFVPPALGAPGAVVVEGHGRNVGTENLDVKVEAIWTLPNGTDLATTNATLGTVKPGQTFTYRMPAVPLPVAGNYSVRVNATSTPAITTFYRVARSDVNLSESFDGTLGRWTADGGMWTVSQEDAAFGNASVLFGLNNSAYYDQRLRLDEENGTFTSPPLELRHTNRQRVLSFWHKPLMSMGQVDVYLEALRDDFEPLPQCSGDNARLLTQLRGREDRWQLVHVPLDAPWPGCSISQRPFQVRFTAVMVSGQGWRLDGVTVGSGAPTLRQAVDRYNITDSASKEYPLIVTNPGLVPKDVVLGIDPLLSRLSPAQMDWITVTPRVLRIDPNGNATATVRVDTPSARGAFPQNLDVVLSATDLAAPLAPSGLRLNLDFRPLPRQDLSVAASVDGRPLGPVRTDIEEAVPHEVSVVITNQGVEASRPTDVRMEIVDDATGLTLWQQTRQIPGLDTYVETEEAFIVSGAWKPDFGARGNRTLRVVVDPDRRLVDYDRSNDDVSLPLAVVRLVRPDLAVDERSFAIATPAGVPVYEAVPGQLVRISAAVTNQGYADARDVTVRLLAGASVLKEEHVPVLRPGETHYVRANQFAPNGTVAYRVLAFTPDLELLAENNERTLELPVFPAEVRIEADALDVMEPGTSRALNVTVADDGPYPLTLRLEVRGNAPLARLERSQIALGPGEARPLELRLLAAPDERAGTHLVVVRALDEDGTVRAQRTIPVRVAERVAATILPHVARGPPGDLLVQLDAVNTGNVALDAAVVLRAPDGTELARSTLDALPQGRRGLVSLRAALPVTTPPARMDATLAVEREGATLAAVPVQLDVLPWSDLDVRATPREDGAYDVHVEHRGNARATRDVVLLDVPPGVDARPSQTRLALAPGDTASFTVHLAPRADAPHGLFKLHLALVDPEPTEHAAPPHLSPLALDLRSAKLDVASVRRDVPAPAEGDTVVYRALVRNDGSRDARGVPVELYVDGLLVDRKEVNDLPPGQSVTVELSWKARPGAHGVVVAVDAHGPMGVDAAAYTEQVEVASSLVPGASFARDVPLPWLPWLVLVFLAVALARRRGS